jgi:hypothetical protein
MVYREEILGIFDNQQTLRPHAALVTDIQISSLLSPQTPISNR